MPVHEIHMCMLWFWKSIHKMHMCMLWSCMSVHEIHKCTLWSLYICTWNTCMYTKILHVIRTQTCLCSQLDRAWGNKAWTRGLTLRVQRFPILNLHLTASNLMLSRCQMLNKALVSWIQQHIKNMSYHDAVDFTPEMQRWVNTWKSINKIHQTHKKIKNRKHVLSHTM